jgi:predicted small metal-binding protein
VIVDTVMTCDCGFEARAGDDDALAAEVQRHAWQAHGMALSHQEALLVFRGEPTRLPTTPRTTRTESNEEER